MDNIRTLTSRQESVLYEAKHFTKEELQQIVDVIIPLVNKHNSEPFGCQIDDILDGEVYVVINSNYNPKECRERIYVMVYYSDSFPILEEDYIAIYEPHQMYITGRDIVNVVMMIDDYYHGIDIDEIQTREELAEMRALAYGEGW